MKFNKSEMQNTAKQLRKYLKKHHKRPKTVKMTDTQGKTHKLKKKQYYSLFKQYFQFRIAKGRFPNYVTYIGKAKEPVQINYQDNSHQCGPASINMCLQGLFDWESETRLAKLFQTGADGTDPSLMKQALNKLGYNMTVIPRNKKAVQQVFESGGMVLMHIDTIKAYCLGYRTDRNFGHYIACTRITKAGNYRIYDPTKGIISCKPSIIDNAMYNREINYYSIKPK